MSVVAATVQFLFRALVRNAGLVSKTESFPIGYCEDRT